MLAIIRTGVAVLALLAPAAAASAADHLKIRVATEAAYKPWNYKEPDGTLVGYDIDVINDICARIDASCELVEHAWDGIFPALQAGQFDAIISGTNSTAERRKTMAFSRNYALSPRRFAVTTDSPITDLDVGLDFIDLDEISPEEQAALDKLKQKLKGKSIGVQVSTTLEKFLRKYLADTVDLRTYGSFEDRDLDLFSGRIDIGMGSTSYLIPAINDGKPLRMVGPGLNGDVFGGGQSIPMRLEDREIADKLSEGINAAIADGSLKKYSIKWFGYDISPPN